MSLPHYFREASRYHDPCHAARMAIESDRISRGCSLDPHDFNLQRDCEEYDRKRLRSVWVTTIKSVSVIKTFNGAVATAISSADTGHRAADHILYC